MDALCLDRGLIKDSHVDGHINPKNAKQKKLLQGLQNKDIDAAKELARALTFKTTLYMRCNMIPSKGPGIMSEIK